MLFDTGFERFRTLRFIFVWIRPKSLGGHYFGKTNKQATMSQRITVAENLLRNLDWRRQTGLNTIIR